MASSAFLAPATISAGTSFDAHDVSSDQLGPAPPLADLQAFDPYSCGCSRAVREYLAVSMCYWGGLRGVGGEVGKHRGRGGKKKGMMAVDLSRSAPELRLVFIEEEEESMAGPSIFGVVYPEELTS